MTGEAGDESCAERLAALKQEIASVQTELATVTGRDIPLVKAAVWALTDAEFETVDDLPAAGQDVRAELNDLAERVSTLEDRVAAIGDVGTEASTKEEKYAAVLAFAANKQGTDGKVAVTPAEIRGCTGVSRRYAYDLVEAMADDIEGVRFREAKQVQTSSGVEQKSKALLVDCERVHRDRAGVNKFTTGGLEDGAG